MDKRIIKHKDVLNVSVAVASVSGQKIYEMNVHALQKRQIVILDFEGINLLTAAFLNVAIGQLYQKYSSAYLKEFLQFNEMQLSDKILLKIVVERAMKYSKNKEAHDQIYKESLEEE